MKSQKSLSSLIFKARKVWSSGYLSLAGKSPLKTVIPVEVTKELANSSHKLKGGIVGNVSLCFDLKTVRQRNTCTAGNKELVGVWGC